MQKRDKNRVGQGLYERISEERTTRAMVFDGRRKGVRGQPVQEVMSGRARIRFLEAGTCTIDREIAGGYTRGRIPRGSCIRCR